MPISLIDELGWKIKYDAKLVLFNCIILEERVRRAHTNYAIGKM